MLGVSGGAAKIGKLIVTLAAVAVDPTKLDVVNASMDGLLHFYDSLRGNNPSLDALVKEIQADFNTLLKKPQFNKPKDARTLLPQMLKASLLSQDDFVKCGLDAGRIMDNLKNRLTNSEHTRPEILGAFDALYRPILKKVCDDPRLTEVLVPALTQVIMRRQEEQDRKLDDIIQLLKNNPKLGPEVQKLAKHEKLTRPIAETYLAETPENPLTALQGINAALEELSKIKERLQRANNLGHRVKSTLDLVNALARDGKLDLAVSTLHAGKAENKEKKKEHETLERLYLKIEITLARSLNNPQMAAKAKIELMELEYPTGVDTSKIVEFGVKKMLYFQRFGVLFDGMVAEALLNIALERAQSEDTQDYVLVDLATIKLGIGSRIGGAGGTKRLSEAVSTYRDILTVRTQQDHPVQWAWTQNNLGIALSNQGSWTGGSDGTKLLAEAVCAHRAALIVWTQQDHPVQWARTQNNLGNALSDQGSRTGGSDGTKLLAEAVCAHRAALTVRTQQDHPVDWAMTQNNLGNALHEQYINTDGAEGTELLAEAVCAYRAALIVRTRQDHPVQWSGTQNNLGNALSDQGSRTGGSDGTKQLAEAVCAYRAALTVRTRQDHPVDWAMTQNNLGIALGYQGSREGTELLAEAVCAYRAALTVRTQQDHPVEWAGTQNNLGIALSNQGSRTGGSDGTKLLAEAVCAHRAALIVWTQQDHPVQWARTQNNLGIAEVAIADLENRPNGRLHLEAALSFVEAAMAVYDHHHMAEYFDNATRLRNDIQAKLG